METWSWTLDTGMGMDHGHGIRSMHM